MVGGFATATPGSCAIECPACPRNLPPLSDTPLSNERPTDDSMGAGEDPDERSDDGSDHDEDDSSVPIEPT